MAMLGHSSMVSLAFKAGTIVDIGAALRSVCRRRPPRLARKKKRKLGKKIRKERKDKDKKRGRTGEETAGDGARSQAALG